ncbi:MAG: NTP transferase domain-containing protein [Planctomycetaceae bacterium]|nr:NTP transferase domain-containing protein [Planctomycetaceae bacterium]
MLKTLGIIDGLLTTERQRRNACRTLGGKTVLEWVARQMTDSERLDGVIVVTDDSEENMFVKQRTPLDIPVFAVGPGGDTLKAVALALEAFPAEHCVFIGLDWPLIDSSLVDRLILAAESNPLGEYAAFHFENSACSIKGRPTGMFAEWYDVRALHRANRKAGDPMYREYPGMYFIEQSPKNTLTLIPAPKQFDRDDIRWTIENEDDWENVVALFESIDADNIQWPRIAETLLHQPHLQAGMKRHGKSVRVK